MKRILCLLTIFFGLSSGATINGVDDYLKLTGSMNSGATRTAASQIVDDIMSDPATFESKVNELSTQLKTMSQMTESQASRILLLEQMINQRAQLFNSNNKNDLYIVGGIILGGLVVGKAVTYRLLRPTLGKMLKDVSGGAEKGGQVKSDVEVLKGLGGGVLKAVGTAAKAQLTVYGGYAVGGIAGNYITKATLESLELRVNANNSLLDK